MVPAAAKLEPLPESRKQRTGRKPEKTNLSAIQMYLNFLGYDAGTADGSSGPKTTDAIRNFQINNGVMASGNSDRETRTLISIMAIKRVQSFLASLGYQPGEANGQLTVNTQQALAAFERDRSLQADGKPDAASLDVLLDELQLAENF